MPKIVIVGAGSGFGSRLSIDILSRPVLQDSTIALCDINEERLEAVTAYVQRAIDHHELPARLESSTERKELLPDADVVITSISVGGYAYWGEPYKSEINIPRKYGVEQMVGDTIGPGGIFRFLRTAPVQLAVCRDMEQLCPDALLLNYTNPMCMLTWLHSEGSFISNVGLCHSVQGTTKELARYLDIPWEEVSYMVAGINHQSWVLRYRHNGRDAYPLISAALEDPEIYARDRVRFEMMKHFGYFVTESTRHNAEYLPYFLRTPELMEQFGMTSREVRDEPGRTREWMKDTGVDGESEEVKVPELKRSHEYASAIIEATTTGEPIEFNGNVMNTGLITNLPQNCCVEVPCLVDREGVHPCHVGALPPQCAALNRSNVAVQELAVRAVLDRDREAAFHACALDPLTAAVVPLQDIRAMFEEMWAAEGDLLDYFG